MLSLILEREKVGKRRGREKWWCERETDQLFPACVLTGDRTRHQGMCPDQGWNLQSWCIGRCSNQGSHLARTEVTFYLEIAFCLGAEKAVLALLNFPVFSSPGVWVAVEMLVVRTALIQGYHLPPFFWAEPHFFQNWVLSSFLLHSCSHVLSHWHLHCVFICSHDCLLPWLSGHQAAPGTTLPVSVGRVLWGAWGLASWVPRNASLPMKSKTSSPLLRATQDWLAICLTIPPQGWLWAGAQDLRRKDSTPFRDPTGLYHSGLSCCLFLSYQGIFISLWHRKYSFKWVT